MAITKANDGSMGNGWTKTLLRLRQLHKSAKGLAARPVLYSRAMDTYYEVRRLITPLLEMEWVRSYPVGTECIPGIDERDVSDTVEAIANSRSSHTQWEGVTWAMIRFELARNLMSRGYKVPYFPGCPCEACKGNCVDEDEKPCQVCIATGYQV